jgi:hypothetical protein
MMIIYSGTRLVEIRACDPGHLAKLEVNMEAQRFLTLILQSSFDFYFIISQELESLPAIAKEKEASLNHLTLKESDLKSKRTALLEVIIVSDFSSNLFTFVSL